MEILDRLHLPLCPQQRIPVKTLVQQLQPTSEDKKILESHIASMKLVSLLNEQTIRIRLYKDDDVSYQAIYVFFIELKKDDSIVSLSQIIHSAFPEPTILIYKRIDRYYISLAYKRINKVEVGKTVVEDVLISQISDKATDIQLDLSIISGSNLKEYYSNITKWLYKLKVLLITNIYPDKDMDYRKVIKQYEQLKITINKLKEDYKKASMKSEKIRIDDELYDKEMELKVIESKLR